MLAQAYKRSLGRWMTWVGVLAFLVWAVLTWYAAFAGTIEKMFLGVMMAGMLLFWTFVLVTVYHFVHAYLSTKDAQRPSP